MYHKIPQNGANALIGRCGLGIWVFCTIVQARLQQSPLHAPAVRKLITTFIHSLFSPIEHTPLNIVGFFNQDVLLTSLFGRVLDPELPGLLLLLHHGHG